MDGDPCDPGGIHRGGLVGEWEALPLVQGLKALQDLTKDGVCVVEVGLGLVEDEELGLVGVGTAVGHTETAPAVVFVVGVEFVRKGDVVSPDAGFLSRHVRRVSPLDHEAPDVPVEDGPVVLAGRRQSQEIEGRPGTGVAEDLGLDVPVGGMNGYRHAGTTDKEGMLRLRLGFERCRRQRRSTTNKAWLLLEPVGELVLDWKQSSTVVGVFEGASKAVAVGHRRHAAPARGVAPTAERSRDSHPKRVGFGILNQKICN